ncbi:hypothetical protein ACSZOD_22280 [Aeromonas hydrophila]
MTTIGLSYSLVKISTKCAPALKYLAPVDYATAIAENIRISGYTNEDGIDGPLGASTALFNYDEARYFCDKQGMELPTDSDIYYLKKIFHKGYINPLMLIRKPRVHAIKR